jgi:hypothetical protein
MKDQVESWHGGVPPGVPGAAWFISAIFAFSVVVLTGWEQGWWDAGHSVAAAPTHHTTGSGNKVQQ